MSINLNCLQTSIEFDWNSRENRTDEMFEWNYRLTSTNFYSKISSKIVEKLFSSNDFLVFLRQSKEKIRYDEKPFSFLRFSFVVLLSICCCLGIFLLKLLHRKSSFWKTKRKSFISIYFLLNFIFLFQLIFLFENLFQTEISLRKSFDHFNEQFYPKKFSESFEKVQNEIEKLRFETNWTKEIVRQIFESFFQIYSFDKLNEMFLSLNFHSNELILFLRRNSIESPSIYSMLNNFTRSFSTHVDRFNENICSNQFESIRIDEKLFSSLDRFPKELPLKTFQLKMFDLVIEIFFKLIFISILILSIGPVTFFLRFLFQSIKTKRNCPTIDLNFFEKNFSIRFLHFVRRRRWTFYSIYSLMFIGFVFLSFVSNFLLFIDLFYENSCQFLHSNPQLSSLRPISGKNQRNDFF